MKLSKSLSDACSLLDAEGTDITRADLLRWYAHARELEDNLELMRMSEVHLAKYSSGHFKRAKAAEAEVARLRGGVIGEEYRAQILANDFNRARNERDALRAKMEKVRAHVEQRQKLLEVGGTKEPPEMAAEFDARYAELDLTLDIIDNEGGDEAE